jgi:hypothetical protein
VSGLSSESRRGHKPLLPGPATALPWPAPAYGRRGRLHPRRERRQRRRLGSKEGLPLLRETARRRSTPCAEALRRGCYAALGARNRRRRGALGGMLLGWGYKRPFILPIRPGSSRTTGADTALRLVPFRYCSFTRNGFSTRASGSNCERPV